MVLKNIEKKRLCAEIRQRPCPLSKMVQKLMVGPPCMVALVAMSTRRTIGVVGSVGRDAAETFRETAVLFVLEAMRKEISLGDMSKICRRIMVAVQIYMYVLLPFFIRITYYTVVFREINCLNGIIMCCLHICKYYHPSQPLLARII